MFVITFVIDSVKIGCTRSTVVVVVIIHVTMDDNVLIAAIRGVSFFKRSYIIDINLIVCSSVRLQTSMFHFSNDLISKTSTASYKLVFAYCKYTVCKFVNNSAHSRKAHSLIFDQHRVQLTMVRQHCTTLWLPISFPVHDQH